MQEVCSALDGHGTLSVGTGTHIKSETTLLNGNGTLIASPNTHQQTQQQQHQQSPQQVTKLMTAVAAAAAVNNGNCDKRMVDTAAATYWAMGSAAAGGGGHNVVAGGVNSVGGGGGGTGESGFINSQPSMAEFLTHLGPDSPKMGVGLGGQLQLQQQQQPQGYGVVTTPDGMDNVPEYPWMKEKKTARKGGSSASQGDLGKWWSCKYGCIRMILPLKNYGT